MVQKSLTLKSCQSIYENIVLKSKNKYPGQPYLCYQVFANYEKIFCIGKIFQT